MDEATQPSIRDSSRKLPPQVNKSGTKSSKPWQDGVNIVSAAAVRPNGSRSSKTSFQGSPKTVNPSSGSSAHMSPNPRRNPPTFIVDGISVNSARGKLQGTNSESQTRDTQSSTQPKKTTKKKVV